MVEVMEAVTEVPVEEMEGSEMEVPWAEDEEEARGAAAKVGETAEAKVVAVVAAAKVVAVKVAAREAVARAGVLAAVREVGMEAALGAAAKAAVGWAVAA